jgi:hypothetical protein
MIANDAFGTGMTTVCSLGIWRKGDPGVEGTRRSLKASKIARSCKMAVIH